MDRQRRDVLIASALLSLMPGACAAGQFAQDAAIYRALFSHLLSKTTESLHIFVAEEPARSQEVLRAIPNMSRGQMLKGLVPATTDSLRNEFLRMLNARGAIDARDLAFDSRFKMTLVSAQEPKVIFESWEQFRARFPDATALLRLSHPAIDGDGQTALVYAGFWCGGTCGGGNLYLLAKLKEGWRVVHDQIVWVA